MTAPHLETPSPERISVLPELRRETAAAHSRLEERVRIDERVQDPARYAQLIEKFFGFYEPLEPRLEALAGWQGIDPAERRKTSWLRRDLIALGSSANDVSALPRCAALPRVDSLARGFGCAYVLEGATLGGRHISGLLQNSPVPTEARNFFASYGPAVGERWKEFIAALEAFAATADDGERSEVVGAARETFRCMEAWLCDEIP